MDFDELYKSVILSEKSILEQVDEYSLYCFYTNIDNLILGKAYNAPYYRLDICPSFSIYEAKQGSVEYMWKDHATGESGTIFKLIQKIEQLQNRQEVLARINEDFALGYCSQTIERKPKLILFEKPEQNDIKIKVVNQPFSELGKEFWQSLHVDNELLSFYSTTQVKYFWSYEGQTAPTTAADPTFAYRVGKFYQLYSPFVEKRYKFRNDLPENYFFGYLQLPATGDKLIIDKSCKDVIFCRKLGYNAVSGKSETTMIPHQKMLELKERFKEVYLMLDNDPPGRKQTEKYLTLYPWLKVRFLEQAKDKTDLVKLVGFEQTSTIVKDLLT